MRVVGIDLSLTATGIARIDSDSRETTPSVRLHGVDGLTTITNLGERSIALNQLASDLADLVRYDLVRPRVVPTMPPIDLVLIETPALSRSRGGVFERGYVWYETVRKIETSGIPIAGVDPGQLKLYATGKGGASKGEVIDAVARRWPGFATRGNDNLADASVLAAMAADLLGQALCPMPATHRRALDKVQLPAVLRG